MPGPEPQTLLELVERRAVDTPGRTALLWEDRPVAFETIWDGACRFGARLADEGVGAGDRVLVVLRNSPEFFQAFYGVQRAGAIAVPLFPGSGRARVGAMARLCGAEVLIGSEPDVGGADGLRVVSVASALASPRGTRVPAVTPDDVAFLQYTSGSTGSPKGVILTHRGLLVNVRQLIDGMSLTAADRFVSWLPVFHDMGLIFMTMVPFYLGAELVLLPTSLANPRPWLSSITKWRGTVTAAPDFAYRLTLRHVRDPGAFDLSSLRVALNAAEPVRPTTIQRFEQAFGLRNVVIAGYGLAEATVGVATWTPGSPPLVDPRGIVCVGRPFVGIDVTILDGDDPVAAGRVGEIAVSSPANTRGYFSDAEETARLFWRGSYVRTGDLGYLDDEGRLFVTGRLKNVIKHAGETIFPQEVEGIVEGLKWVRRCAAVGIDAGGPEGEQLHVFAELSRPGSLDVAALEDLVVETVQAIHGALGLRPGRVLLLRPHAIPVTPNGKTQHAALRDQFRSGDLRSRQMIVFPDD